MKPWKCSREAVDAVFLPRKMPGFASLDSHGFGYSHEFLAEFIECCEELEDILPDRAKGMIDRWDKLYDLRIADLEQCCSTLDVGSTLAIHLHAQNAAVTLTKVDTETVAVRAFEVQQCMQVIAATEGPITSTVPHSSVYAPLKLVFSTSFLEQLVALQKNAFRDTEARTKRNSETLQEPREVSSPKYVLEWLMSVLFSFGSVEKTLRPVQKKVGNALLFTANKHKGLQPWQRHAAWIAFKSVLHSTLVNDAQCTVVGTVQYKAAMLHYMTSFLRQPIHQEDHDRMQQMLAKISQRLHNLESLLDEH